MIPQNYKDKIVKLLIYFNTQNKLISIKNKIEKFPEIIVEPTWFIEKETVVIKNTEIENNVYIIVDSHLNGLYYTVFNSNFNKEKGITNDALGLFDWLRVRKLFKENKYENSLFSEPLNISYSNQVLKSLIHYKFESGLNLNPTYQRELVWTLEDKQNYIDSIFNYVDLGKIALILEPIQDVYTPAYEVLDGKQRISCIVDYYTDQFCFKNRYYSELSKEDQLNFLNRNISIGVINNENNKLTLKDKINMFIKINTFGKIVDNKHILYLQENFK